ncbi:MAG TPA: ADOP family duplicated permease [Bryobacteraceae bacterium]|nr:ADOP family duplicated permease [Bryobacteraceae bacterium]
MRAAFQRDRRDDELDEELRFHLEAEAEERMQSGLTPEEARAAARRSLGNVALVRENTRMLWSWMWLDNLARDWRYAVGQLLNNRVTSAAAILSLALALGSCTAAFRLIDALLLRPLPVKDAERLYVISRETVGHDGKPFIFDGCEHPLFRRMRTEVNGTAEVIGMSYTERTDVTYRSDSDMEKANVQYVSGSMFSLFGLNPVLGRLLTEQDDLTPGRHPQAVLSHDYWSRRFGNDPQILGRTFRLGKTLFEVIGVAEEKFTGTEPGTIVDLFVPNVMHPHVERPGSTWLRAFVRLRAGADPAPVRERLQSVMARYQKERAAGFLNFSPHALERFMNQKLALKSATSGASVMQDRFRVGLVAIAAVAGFVLLIATANVAILMTTRASARSREMALRICIGAGRRRLVQMVLVESLLLALMATTLGSVLAWWAAPFIVSLVNSASNPVRLEFPADWRLVSCGLCLTLCVTVLFGLTPAWRASAVKPARALKGGEDPHARARLMHGLIFAQAAFCFVVLFTGGLFVTTLNRLAHQPLGFSPERVLALYTVAAQPRSAAVWEQVAAHLRTVAGVQSVAVSDRALLDGSGWNNFISVNGGPPGETPTFLRAVSPGWLGVMGVPLLEGRDLRPMDQYPGAAVVNLTFARIYFSNQNPVGRSFVIPSLNGKPSRFEIVGLVGDARYRTLREPILPVAYVPILEVDQAGHSQPRDQATLIVRTSTEDPSKLAQVLRGEVTKAQSGFRVSNVRPQTELIQMQTVRERLLAKLAVFFGVVALCMSAVGLYAVLDFSVLRRRREIGIMVAIGAPMRDILGQIVIGAFLVTVAGAVVGMLLGISCEPYIRALLYEVKATDSRMLVIPSIILLGVAALATIGPVVRAARIDPVRTLRTE